MAFTFKQGDKPLEGFTVQRGVGRGGFGEVYYAVSDGGKEVALKLVRRNLDIEIRGVTQCLNLKHPNLVHLYDVRKDPDQIKNLANDPAYAKAKADLAAQLMKKLTDAKDPRVTGDGKTFERPPFTDAVNDGGEDGAPKKRKKAAAKSEE